MMEGTGGGVTGRSSSGQIGRILVGAAVMFAILQGGLTLLIPTLDQTSAALAVSALMFAVALLIERVVFGRDTRLAFLALGFGRPRAGAIAVAGIITAVMLAFFPLYSLATGFAFNLRSDWLWVLVGAVALNGLAEETLFRGFVFGHLRQAGQSFRRAGFISMAIFAAVHLFLFASNPFVVAFLATLLAISAAFPLAFLFERAGATIWAGVILHVAGHAFRLFDVPADQMVTVGSAWIVLQLGAVFLVFLFRGTLLQGFDATRPVKSPLATPASSSR